MAGTPYCRFFRLSCWVNTSLRAGIAAIISGRSGMPDAVGPSPSEKALEESFSARQESPEQLFSQVYQELRQVARAYMRGERADHTLQATALVHEAYLRLFEGQPFRWE